MPNTYGNNTGVAGKYNFQNPYTMLTANLSKVGKIGPSKLSFHEKAAMNFLASGINISLNTFYPGSIAWDFFDSSLAPQIAMKIQSSQPYQQGYVAPKVSWQNTYIFAYANAPVTLIDLTGYFYDQWQYNNSNPWAQPIRVSLTEANVLGGGGHVTNPSRWDYATLLFP